jgi:hypothetical protein
MPLAVSKAVYAAASSVVARLLASIRAGPVLYASRFSYALSFEADLVVRSA